MRVWFLASQSLPFTPRLRIEDQRVGGSEMALFWIARGLARLGHDVVVLNHCHPDEGQYEGVRYLDVSIAKPVWRNEGQARPPDVLVLFRRMLDVLTDLPSKMRVFWAHDYQGVHVSDQPSLGRSLAVVWRRLTGPLFHGRVNQVFVVSQFMADLFEWLFRAPPKKLVVMPNGVDVSLFQGTAPARVPMKFVHSSVPDRGLGQLLREIFPRIRSAHPQAELHVFSYHPLDAYQRYATGGVTFHGWVTKEELIRALRESSMMLYPANFEEMGAISVLESMAAGTPAVTSTLGVLAELAAENTRGIAVPGRPGTQEFANRFVHSTLELLSDPSRLDRMRSDAREFVLTHHDWDAIVRRWDRVLREPRVV
jgi:glycosyltransferase involved in cell wall biosynthesis